MLNDIFEQLKNGKVSGFPHIEKKGTLAVGIVESTPVVWKGRLLRFEWLRGPGFGGNSNKIGIEEGCFHFVDMETNEWTKPFAIGYSFGCAHVEEEKMYVFGSRGLAGGSAIDTFVSDDLENWEKIGELEVPKEFNIFNSSVCKGPDKYMMTIEIGGKSPLVGTVFTNFFAESKDLAHWNLLPMDRYEYSKERYTACPVLRYVNGFYYMIYLERMPCHRYVPYIVRTVDFEHFEMGIKSPVLWYGEEDRRIYREDWLTEEEKELVKSCVDTNNSDVDICEFNGKTVILYSWGNQATHEFLALAEYDGPMQEFLKSFFN